MATQLDPSIIGRAVQPTVPLNNIASIYGDAANIRQHMLAGDQAQEALRQKKLQSDAYAYATDENGNVDNNKLVAYYAQNQGGSNIPAMQKTILDNRKAQTEISEKESVTNKNEQEVLHNGLKLIDNSIASLAARPDVNEQMVYGEMGRLVNAGAFDLQAKKQGVDRDTYVRKTVLDTMPVGNPQALRGWLIQQGARVADATQRLAMSLPKYDEQDRGGVINQGTVDQMTGRRTAGQDVVKTASPDTVANNNVAIRGQDMTDTRQGEANDINRQAARSQVMETAGGLVSVDKGKNVATPVMGPNGAVYSAESSASKNAVMASRLKEMIPQARALLKGATSSGLGAQVDAAGDYFGKSTSGADKAAALDTISGWMTSNVPRFEGPQSDKDTQTYKIMAGLVGDRTKPMSQRVAALDQVEQLMGKYQLNAPGGAPPPGQPTVPYSGPDRRGGPGAAPAGAPLPPIDSFFRK